MHDEPFALMQRLAPDLAQEIERRALVLERIGALQPVGRRQLAARLNMPEREVRTVAMLLKDHGLIELDATGMRLTPSAQEVLPQVQLFTSNLRSLTQLEKQLEDRLGVCEVCIVPGDADADQHVLNDVGRSAAARLRSFLHSGATLAVTGGSTMRLVADHIPHSSLTNVMVVPARGGVSGDLQVQANTVASLVAQNLGGHHRLMHLPDQLDEQTLAEMRKLAEIDETLTLLERADVVLHGIGRVNEMLAKRQLSQTVALEVRRKAALAEAYGCYFNQSGKLVYTASTVAHRLGAYKPQSAFIAEAAGTQKAQANQTVLQSRPYAMLVTDEGAARAILGH